MKQSWYIVNKQTKSIVFDSDIFQLIKKSCYFLSSIEVDEFFNVVYLEDNIEIEVAEISDYFNGL